MNVKRGLEKVVFMAAVSLFIFGLAGSAMAQTWIDITPAGGPDSTVISHQPAGIGYDAVSNRLILYFPTNPSVTGSSAEVWVLTNANGLGGTATWIKLFPSGSPAFTNALVSVVYDQGSNRLIVYGGCYANCSPPLSNVFVLTNANGLGGTPVWSQSTLTNPQPRAAHTSVYDSANNLMISFGGHLAFPGIWDLYNDTRLLSNANGDLSPSAWTSLGTSGGPPPIRSDHSAIYDQANNRMTIFGGDKALGCCPWVQDSYNDTWVLSNANGHGGIPTWSQLFPLGTPPTSGSYRSAVYDAVNNRMLVFGGGQFDNATENWVLLGGLWQLSNANGIGTPTWTELPQLGTPPGPRFQHTAAFDEANQRMILFGGVGSSVYPWWPDYNQISNRVWILVFNNPPTAICQDVTVSAGPDCTANASIDNGSFDPDSGDTITLAQTPPGPYPLGMTSVTLTVTDNHGASSQCIANVTVVDVTRPVITCPPDITTAGNIPGSCGATVAVGSASATDNCSGVEAGGVRNNGGALTDPYPLGATTITWTATDGAGNSALCQQLITVTNPNPAATITNPPGGDVYAVGTPVNFSGTFTDNPGGTHSAQWMFDSIVQTGLVNEGAGSVTATHTFTAAGVYAVKLTVSDGCGGSGDATTVGGLDAMVVIYDPSGGFVTGGGWINSPAGTLAAQPLLTGRANFGFVSKYQRGAAIPTGETEFNFKVANLNFHSTSYDWLVIAGARAQYKGMGTINGAGNYGFMLTAIDGQISGGGGVDKFRIKIWDKNNGDAIVYDNQMASADSDNPTTALGGGSIVIHK